MKNRILKNWLPILFILQPMLDIIAYFQYDNIIGSAAGYFRMLIMVVLPIYVLFLTKYKKSFIALFVVMGLYSVLHILNGFRIGYVSIVQDVSYLLRVLQMPVLTISFMYYLRYKLEEDQDDMFTSKIGKSFLFIGAFILVSMIIAHMTNTAQFTYVNEKIGYLGWFANSNSQSIILTGLVPLIMYYIYKTKNKTIFLLGAVLSTILLLTNGTKGAYYSNYLICFGMIAFIIFVNLIRKEKIKKFQIYAMIILLMCGVAGIIYYPYSPRYEIDNAYYTARESESIKMEEELNKISGKDVNGNKKFDVNDPEILEQLLKYYTPKMEKGLVKRFGAERVLKAYNYTPDPYILSDTRLAKRMYAEFIWEDSDFLTKLVGFEFSRIEGYDLENDYPAIFYYYGYIGFALYVVFILYFVLFTIRTLFSDFLSACNLKNFALFITLLLQLGLAQFSGALLRRPNASIYLSIILALIYYECKNIQMKKIK